jgi:hypothetical protein
MLVKKVVNTQRERPSSRWKDNITMDLKKPGCNVWSDLIIRGQRPAVGYCKDLVVWLSH